MDVVFLQRLIALIVGYLATPDTSNSGKLFITAVSSLGKDASPNDVAPDELGCAETVDTIHKKAFGSFISDKLSLSTTELVRRFKQGNGWQRVVVAPQAGDIVIAATGEGTNPQMPHGHVGIVSKDGRIMSNSSATGLFMENFTIDTFYERYATRGGYPVRYYRKV